MIDELYFIDKVSFASLLFPVFKKHGANIGAPFRQTIQTAVKTAERGALLTTHYLAEAEAVCDRVAIMVSGRLRWVS